MKKSKKTNSAIVPKLRFPEFQNAGEWEKKQLDSLTDIAKGEQINGSNLTITGHYPYLNGGINPSGYTNNYNTSEDTIAISEGGNSCGYVNFMTTKFWCGGHCYSLLNIKDSTNIKFLCPILH